MMRLRLCSRGMRAGRCLPLVRRAAAARAHSSADTPPYHQSRQEVDQSEPDTATASSTPTSGPRAGIHRHPSFSVIHPDAHDAVVTAGSAHDEPTPDASEAGAHASAPHHQQAAYQPDDSEPTTETSPHDDAVMPDWLRALDRDPSTASPLNSSTRNVLGRHATDAADDSMWEGDDSMTRTHVQGVEDTDWGSVSRSGLANEADNNNSLAKEWLDMLANDEPGRVSQQTESSPWDALFSASSVDPRALAPLEASHAVVLKDLTPDTTEADICASIMRLRLPNVEESQLRVDLFNVGSKVGLLECAVVDLGSEAGLAALASPNRLMFGLHVRGKRASLQEAQYLLTSLRLTGVPHSLRLADVSRYVEQHLGTSFDPGMHVVHPNERGRTYRLFFSSYAHARLAKQVLTEHPIAPDQGNPILYWAWGNPKQRQDPASSSSPQPKSPAAEAATSVAASNNSEPDLQVESELAAMPAAPPMGDSDAVETDSSTQAPPDTHRDSPARQFKAHYRGLMRQYTSLQSQLNDYRAFMEQNGVQFDADGAFKFYDASAAHWETTSKVEPRDFWSSTGLSQDGATQASPLSTAALTSAPPGFHVAGTQPQTLEHVNARYAQWALQRKEGNMDATAAALGIERVALQALLDTAAELSPPKRTASQPEGGSGDVADLLSAIDDTWGPPASSLSSSGSGASSPPPSPAYDPYDDPDAALFDDIMGDDATTTDNQAGPSGRRSRKLGDDDDLWA